MVSALILIADGTEEMEFTIVYDTLVRAGVACTSAFVPPQSPQPSQAPLFATGSRGIKIVPDVQFSAAELGPDKFDLLVVPGGATGAATISNDPSCQKLVKEYLDKGKHVGMICAGSLAALTSTLSKQPLTSHPSVKSQLDQAFEYSELPVVISGNLVTSRGPGTAFPFALALVEILRGSDVREQVRGPMIFPEGTPW